MAALYSDILTNADFSSIVEFKYDTIETWTNGQCVGVGSHTTKCTNQTSQDGYCDCLADAANHCAAAHDSKWWDFTACMFENNGEGSAGTGLKDDSTFETTVKTCSDKLASYSFADLKACYTGVEGNTYIYDSAQATTKAVGGLPPKWVYVGSTFVSGDDYEDASEWAAAVVTAICSAYTGTKPSSCGSVDVVV